MAYQYEPGAVRWKRWNGKGDVRAYVAPEGWNSSAELLERHPLTDKPFKESQWWIRERLRYIAEKGRRA